jgi:hypothetical protein
VQNVAYPCAEATNYAAAEAAAATEAAAAAAAADATAEAQPFETGAALGAASSDWAEAARRLLEVALVELLGLLARAVAFGSPAADLERRARKRAAIQASPLWLLTGLALGGAASPIIRRATCDDKWAVAPPVLASPQALNDARANCSADELFKDAERLNAECTLLLDNNLIRSSRDSGSTPQQLSHRSLLRAVCFGYVAESLLLPPLAYLLPLIMIAAFIAMHDAIFTANALLNPLTRGDGGDGGFGCAAADATIGCKPLNRLPTAVNLARLCLAASPECLASSAMKSTGGVIGAVMAAHWRAAPHFSRS